MWNILILRKYQLFILYSNLNEHPTFEFLNLATVFQSRARKRDYCVTYLYISVQIAAISPQSSLLSSTEQKTLKLQSLISQSLPSMKSNLVFCVSKCKNSGEEQMTQQELGALWSRGLGTTTGSSWVNQIPLVVLDREAPKGRNNGS